MRHIAHLSDRAVLSVTGQEAAQFLQGLVTNDIDLVQDQQALYAALLTPQGKILFDFLISLRNGRYLIDCAIVRQDELIKRLNMYRLRAKLEIRTEPELHVAAAWGANKDLPANAFVDPRLAALGARLIAPEKELPPGHASASDYHAHRIGLGVPDGRDLVPDTIFALDAGLEELNGVSFRKGCFVGQEVTARMKHRASARRRILIVQADSTLPEMGAPVVADNTELGNLLTSQGNRALALIRLDRFTEAKNARANITAGNLNVSLRKPDWLRM